MADRINFAQPINDSAQVGDILYFASVSPTDPTQTNGPVTEIGPITTIGENFVEVTSGAPTGFTETDIETGFTTVTITGGGVTGPATIPVAPPLFMFRKDGRSNISTLVGYFAEVNLVQNATDRRELFGIGSEIFVSSK